jgi:hypothetical protein
MPTVEEPISVSGVFMVAGRLVVGSGRCGRVPDVDVATLTSATGG